MNAEMKVLIDLLIQREDLIPSLKQAAIYMETMRKKQRMLMADQDDVPDERVPKDYAHIMPIANAFYNDYKGWSIFLRTLRDGSGWGTKDPRWRKLHELMRLADINTSQTLARGMAGEAADLYAQTHPFHKGDRTKYTSYCRGVWREQLALKIKNARTAGGKDRLPQDERQEITEAFWQTIRDQLDNGNIPTPPPGLLQD